MKTSFTDCLDEMVHSYHVGISTVTHIVWLYFLRVLQKPILKFFRNLCWFFFRCLISCRSCQEVFVLFDHSHTKYGCRLGWESYLIYFVEDTFVTFFQNSFPCSAWLSSCNLPSVHFDAVLSFSLKSVSSLDEGLLVYSRLHCVLFRLFCPKNITKSAF